jgi:hypothetical protein
VLLGIGSTPSGRWRAATPSTDAANTSKAKAEADVPYQHQHAEQADDDDATWDFVQRTHAHGFSGSGPSSCQTLLQLVLEVPRGRRVVCHDDAPELVSASVEVKLTTTPRRAATKRAVNLSSALTVCGAEAPRPRSTDSRAGTLGGIQRGACKTVSTRGTNSLIMVPPSKCKSIIYKRATFLKPTETTLQQLLVAALRSHRTVLSRQEDPRVMRHTFGLIHGC